MSYLNHRLSLFTSLSKRTAIMLCIMLLAVLGIAQTPAVTASECNCLNNATLPGNGQFEEVLRITAPAGQTWRIKYVVGLFNIASPAPPALPIQLVPGAIITETGPGQYTLRAKRRDNTSWNIVFTNGTTDLPINATKRCKYPSQDFVGDKGVCINKSRTYSLDIPSNLINSISWSISGSASIVGATNQPKLTVQFTSTVGEVVISATGSAKSFVGQSSGFCSFNIRDTIKIINEPDAIFLACRDKVNITVDAKCELLLTPDIILEDQQLPNSSYDVRLRDIQADTFLPTNFLTSTYINKKLEVSVFHDCSGNSCWGTLLVEDKSIPPLVCPPRDTINCEDVDKPEFSGLPLPSTAFYMPIGPKRYKVQDYDFCSDVILTYNDEKSSSHCVGGISAVFNRTWVATDALGNSTSCVQEIAVRQAVIDSIKFPPNYDDVLGPNPSLGACDTWKKLANGHPDPDFTGRPTGVLCLNLNVDFEDIRFDICDNDKTFKIRRKWTVTDGCTGRVRVMTQTITVMDNTAPTCTPPADFTVGTTDRSCVSTITVPLPVVDDCTEWRYSIAYKPVDNSGDPYTDAIIDGILKATDTQYVIQGISENHTQYWISYYIFDGCGNSSRCFTKVTIKDDKDPVAICKEFTFVGLNETGMAWAGIESFDNGSYDNCAIGKIDVKRMDLSPCGQSDTFSNKVQFCCADLGKTIMVQMRVTDKSGNSNTCMVRVTVQDNTPPRFVSCPADVTIDCGSDLHNLGRFGQPTVVDSCGFTLVDTVRRALNECGIGTITRVFIATDVSGNKATCDQVITVRPTTPFNQDSIVWPIDHTIINGCRGAKAEPKDLPLNAQYPKFMYKACSKPAYNYEDIVFQYADGACFKILREWTVIDWCQFTPHTENQVSWKHTQVIKVMNNVAPTIIKGCGINDITVEDAGGCDARIMLRAEATDDCINPLYYTYEIDLDNNGTIDFKEQTQTINRVVRYGNHKITWFVRDECGNISQCTRVWEVRDPKKPTPICHSQVVSVVMPSSRMLTLWAKDFIKEGLDNCTPASQLKYSFTSNPKDSSKVFTCQDFIDGIAAGVPIRIYVFDLEGNFDFCEAKLILQDNSNVCGGGTASGSLLEGKVNDTEGRAMGKVQVTINTNAPSFPRLTQTDASGNYIFANLSNNLEYSLGARYTDEPIKGVNTIDILRIQRHILGIQKLPNQLQMLAADANGDQRVTVADMVELRKLVLGITNDFGGRNPWLFIEKANINPDNIYPYTEEIRVSNLSSNISGKDFVAVKVGDIDGSYASSALSGRSTNTHVLLAEEDANDIEGTVTVRLSTEQPVDVAAFETELLYNSDAYEFDQITDQSALGNEQVYYYKKNNGRIALLWTNGRNATITNNVVELRFKAIDNSKESVSLQVADVTKNNSLYAINNLGQIEQRTIEIKQKQVLATEGLRVLQNTPNPFSSDTDISFEINKDEQVTIMIFNTEGKVVYQQVGDYRKGLNTVRISAEDINAQGILFYQILTKTHYAGRRMIKLK